FKIGIGPSSSHTVGPMRAARMFAKAALSSPNLADLERVVVELYGSLGATGKGHGTDTAVMLGLAGHDPETVEIDRVDAILQEIRDTRSIRLLGEQHVAFDAPRDIPFHPFKALPFHPNGMRCLAYGADGTVLLERVYYSVGGGFVVQGDGDGKAGVVPPTLPDMAELPMPFRSGEDLLRLCNTHQC